MGLALQKPLAAKELAQIDLVYLTGERVQNKACIWRLFYDYPSLGASQGCIEGRERNLPVVVTLSNIPTHL